MTNTHSAQVTNTDWQVQQNFNTYINIEWTENDMS